MNRFLTAAAAIFLTSGCAVVHKVDLPASGASAGGADVMVSDERLDTALKLQSIAGSGGNFMLLETSPSIATTLSGKISGKYQGSVPLQVGIERIELLSKIGFMRNDDMSCGVESTLKVGSGETAVVRTRLHNIKNLSPVITTMARVLLEQCLDEHAKDISTLASK